MKALTAFQQVVRRALPCGVDPLWHLLRPSPALEMTDEGHR